MSEAGSAALDRFRRDWSEALVQAQARFRIDDMVGLTVDAARAQVVDLGGEFVTDDRPIAAKLDLNRVIATVSGGYVIAARVG
jgi:hypothetical protein